MKYTKIKPIKDPDKIISYWKNQKLTVALIIISGLIFNGGTVLGPIYQGKLIDSLLREDNLSKKLSRKHPLL